MIRRGAASSSASGRPPAGWSAEHRHPRLSQAFAADLLERDQSPLSVRQGAVELNLKPHGYAALRLAP